MKTLHNSAMSIPYAPIKRAIDITASAAGLLVLAPVFVPISLAVALTSPGPVLFGHTRVGKNGAAFRMFKFRSMVKDASLIGSYQTAANDARITKVGAFLRRTSLDELPQLINVLKGDMSLIGPRPDTPQQEMGYTPEQWVARHRVKPGITGLAQVNGRSNITLEQRTAYDLAYAAAPTLAGDIRIIIDTARKIITREGAN